MAPDSNSHNHVDTDIHYTSILVIDRTGKLLRVTCPFRVRLKGMTAKGLRHQVFQVDEVRPSELFIMEYHIKSKPYPFSLFVILLP
jgi:hypothetical protein